MLAKPKEMLIKWNVRNSNECSLFAMVFWLLTTQPDASSAQLTSQFFFFCFLLFHMYICIIASAESNSLNVSPPIASRLVFTAKPSHCSVVVRVWINRILTISALLYWRYGSVAAGKCLTECNRMHLTGMVWNGMWQFQCINCYFKEIV